MDGEQLSERELDRRLQRSNPVDRAALEDPQVHAALTSLRESIASGALQQESTPATPRRVARQRPAIVRPVPRRRWAIAGFAAVAVAAGSLAGVQTLTGGAGGSGVPLAVSPAAAAELGRVARAAGAQPTPGAGQLPYLEYRSETTVAPFFGGARAEYTYTQTLQNWTGADGRPARQRVTADGISFATPQDRATGDANRSAFDAAFNQLNGPDAPPQNGLVFDHLFRDYAPYRAPVPVGSSASQAAMAQEVARGTERPDGPQELIADLTDALDNQPADLWAGLLTILRSSTDAQLRETAYRALAYVPGTTVLGARTDQLGRHGIAIRFSGVPDDAGLLIVSPTTGLLLQEDSYGGPSGTVMQRELDVKRGFVGSDTALPGGGSQPLTAATRTEDMRTGKSTPSTSASR